MRIILNLIYISVATISSYSFANLFDVPLRSLELKSSVKVDATLLNQISSPSTVYIQDASIQHMGVDEKKPYCELTKFSYSTSHEEAEVFLIDSVEGAFVYDPSFFTTSTFRTKLKLSNPYQFLELTCVNPLGEKQRIEEISINDLAVILGNYLSLDSLNIKPGTFEPRFSPPITIDLIKRELSLKLNKAVSLNIDESHTYYFAVIGKCRFFSWNNEISLHQNQVLRAISFEMTYTFNELINLNPSIILRFNESSGIQCKGSSEKRMFDYQDFWDATGKKDIDWILNI